MLLVCWCALLLVFFGGFANQGVESKHLHGTPKYLSIEEKAPYWKDREKEALLKMLLRKPNFNKAKNIIFFLGDGMSLTTVSTSRIYKGQLNGGSGEEGSLFFEDFPNTGLVKVLKFIILLPTWRSPAVRDSLLA
ncbi:hypothetical protein GE061_015051 [Apolygus lucorum]|uniref:alkaline phosphatase n=1 Tax=Apolygus lucorum TaxID=248454 RepID=A0A8S9XNZ4_APOLU|nr:hypothetical protein GE061_015051 [Apolygus lucorum]